MSQSSTASSAVVIGAGITGILTAHRLLQDGWRVVLLDAHHVGFGSTVRSAACARQQFSTSETVAMMLHSIVWYRDFRMRFNTDEPAMEHVGYLYPYWEGHHDRFVAAQTRVTMQRRIGLRDVELLMDPSDVLQRWPFLAPERADLGGLIGAHFCGSDGFCFPSTIIAEVIKHCQRVFSDRFELRLGSPVMKVLKSGSRVVAIKTPHGEVSGDVFFNCTNAWTVRLEAMLYGLSVERMAQLLPVDPLRRYLWFMPAPNQRSVIPCMLVLPEGVYARPEGNGAQVMMGHAHQTPPEYTFADDDQDLVKGESTELGINALSILADAVPAMGEYPLPQHTTSGFYGSTPDHNPFLCADPHHENWIKLVGHSGHGIMMAPAVAEVGAALARGEHGSVYLADQLVDLSVFHQRRAFSRAEGMVI